MLNNVFEDMYVYKIIIHTLLCLLYNKQYYSWKVPQIIIAKIYRASGQILDFQIVEDRDMYICKICCAGKYSIYFVYFN